MNNAAHYNIGLDLKRKAKELVYIDTVQLGFDAKILEETDTNFADRCKSGTNDFREIWFNELIECYDLMVDISGWGDEEWDLTTQNYINSYSKQLMLRADGIYKISNHGRLTFPAVWISFELIFDTQTTFNRVYRLSIKASIVDGDLNPIDTTNNNIQVFQYDYLANQINLFEEHWKELSGGDFIIAIIKWLINE